MINTSCDLSEDNKRLYYNQIDSNLDMDSEVSLAVDQLGVVDKIKLQTCLTWQHIMPKSGWDAVQDNAKPIDQILLAWAALAKKRGLNNPTEKSVVHIVATAFAARRKLSVASDNANRLSAVRYFKSIVRSLPFIVQGPQTYPHSVEELRETNEVVYKTVLKCASEFGGVLSFP